MTKDELIDALTEILHKDNIDREECGRFKRAEVSCLNADCGGDVCDFTSVYGRVYTCVDCGLIVTAQRIGVGDD